MALVMRENFNHPAQMDHEEITNLTDGPNVFKVQPQNIILDQRVRIKFALGDTSGSSFRMNIKLNYLRQHN